MRRVGFKLKRDRLLTECLDVAAQLRSERGLFLPWNDLHAEDHSIADAIRIAIGRHRKGIAPTKHFAAPGAIDEPRPEAIEIFFVQIAPAIRAIETDKHGAAGAI